MVGALDGYQGALVNSAEALTQWGEGALRVFVSEHALPERRALRSFACEEACRGGVEVERVAELHARVALCC